MSALLHVDSSPRAASVSSLLASVFVEKWKQQNPTGTVFHHNASRERFPFLDEDAIAAIFTPSAKRTAAQKKTLAFSDQLVDELLAADVVVLGAPMWNLSIPASLKAWIAYPAGTPFQDLDQQEPYLRKILGVIGLTRIDFICAEHQSGDAEAAAQGLAQAESHLAELPL